MPLDIKICGLKTDDAMEAALAAGASHVGFIFFPRSPRWIEPVQAGRLRTRAAGKAQVVAVTVDADDAFLEAIVASVRPDMLQLHGSEPPARVAELKRRYALPVVKAFSVRDAADLVAVQAFRGIADLFLFDARPPAGSDLPGGNGVAFDWALLGSLDPAIGYFLSGGLTAANVGEALRLAGPSGIDVSSGVESAPGVKDPMLIAAFLEAVRAGRHDRAA